MAMFEIKSQISSRILSVLPLAAALLLAGCYDPHKKYTLDAATALAESGGEAAAREAAPFGDGLVRYLRNDKGKKREQGSEFVLQVEFEPGGFAPRMDTLADIEALLVIMRDFPSLHVALEGHTDNDGDPEKNHKLSESRANWVRHFLLERGIAAERVEAAGFGDSHPISDNSTPAGQKQNRRLVLRVLGQ